MVGVKHVYSQIQTCQFEVSLNYNSETVIDSKTVLYTNTCLSNYIIQWEVQENYDSLRDTMYTLLPMQIHFTFLKCTMTELTELISQQINFIIKFIRYRSYISKSFQQFSFLLPNYNATHEYRAKHNCILLIVHPVKSIPPGINQFPFVISVLDTVFLFYI